MISENSFCYLSPLHDCVRDRDSRGGSFPVTLIGVGVWKVSLFSTSFWDLQSFFSASSKQLGKSFPPKILSQFFLSFQFECFVAINKLTNFINQKPVSKSSDSFDNGTFYKKLFVRKSKKWKTFSANIFCTSHTLKLLCVSVRDLICQDLWRTFRDFFRS